MEDAVEVERVEPGLTVEVVDAPTRTARMVC